MQYFSFQTFRYTVDRSLAYRVIRIIFSKHTYHSCYANLTTYIICICDLAVPIETRVCVINNDILFEVKNRV